MYKPMVSIIVPTYNEEKDIIETLDALVSLDYDKKEIIIVDDCSEDKTVEIVQKYLKNNNIKLLRQSVNRGVASARNKGIKSANGDIVSILNADVNLPKDFISKIIPHYENGADFLLVESKVMNTHYVFPRYIEAQHHFLYDNRDDIVWTEGFSCRTNAALDVGLFPESIPGASGEDVDFGKKLEKKYKKVIDRSIVVQHIAPPTFREFWKQRKGRGRGTPYMLFYIEKRSLNEILLQIIISSFLTILSIIAIYPFIMMGFKLSKFSNCNTIKESLLFSFCDIINLIGQGFGNWYAYFEIRRNLLHKKW